MKIYNPNLGDAYTDRSEGRWWLFHWTPAGMIVRLLTSYPDKASALQAISTLGYRAVPKPLPADAPETVTARGKVTS